MADAWEAFGSDDDDSDDEGTPQDSRLKSIKAAASEVASFLAKFFIHANSKVPIGKRIIGLPWSSKKAEGTLEPWKIALVERGFSFTDKTSHERKYNSADFDWHDAFLIGSDQENEAVSELISKSQDYSYESLVPGGILLIVCQKRANGSNINIDIDATEWEESTGKEATFHETICYSDDNLQVIALRKRLCQIQEKSCPWLSSKHSNPKERNRVQEATVPVSVHEIREHCLTEKSIEVAVQMLQDHGYCIIPRLLDPEQSLQWGNAVLSDLHRASSVLLEKEEVDIFNPHTSEKDPQSYRELSMREDLRMDLRDGPQLRKLRGCIGNKPIILKSNEAMPTVQGDNNYNNGTERPNPFFRHDPSMLEIVRRTMNPKVGELYKGNFGRYNFGGSGPDGSFQDMRLGWIGGIVSLPGSADQALHADAPHLFETGTLPAHYINAFTPGCQGSPSVGCTAFIHGSHTIEFTTKYMGESDNKVAIGNSHEAVFDQLVRPQLELGDVLLFDCRTLHFGLANTSKSIERPLVYCNMTHAWFIDPKNWDDQKPIFVESDFQNS